MPSHYKIGKIAGVHGLNGELVLKHALGKKTSLKGINALFIEEKKDNLLPWFVQSSKIRKEDEVVLKLEGAETREAAMKLNQKEVWMKEDDFKKFTAKSSAISLLGYMLIDNDEKLGEIQEVIEQPHQITCRLEMQGKEVLIPINEDFLEKIDHRKKLVYVSLPEGLLEVYLV